MTLGGSIIFCILQMRSWSSENFDTRLMLQLPKWTFSFKNSFSMNSFWINLCPKDCLQSSHHPLVWLHFLISPEEGCLTKLLADFFFFLTCRFWSEDSWNNRITTSYFCQSVWEKDVLSLSPCLHEPFSFVGEGEGSWKQISLVKRNC